MKRIFSTLSLLAAIALCGPSPVAALDYPQSPLPPRATVLPNRYVVARTGAELNALLATASAPQTVVLEDGTYTYTGPIYVNMGGHKIIARHTGKAILKFGIYSDYGIEIRGVAFNIDEANKTWNNAVVYSGPSVGTIVADTTIDGNNVVSVGIYFSGLARESRIERVVISNLTGWANGITISDWLGYTAAGTGSEPNGFIRFTANPTANATITLNGTTWTFVTGTPTGNQTQIKATKELTAAQLATDLAASADAQVSKATYRNVTSSGSASAMVGILYKMADGQGNSFTLAAQAAANVELSAYPVAASSATSGQLFSRVTDPILIEDVNISNVHHATPHTANGTAEMCIWAGERVHINRARLIDCGWSGINVVGAGSGSLIEDVYIGKTGDPCPAVDKLRPAESTCSPMPTINVMVAGIYLERHSWDTRIRRTLIDKGAISGVTCEYADPAYNGLPGCRNVVIENSRIDAYCIGIGLDEGTQTTTARGVTFVGQAATAINNYQGVGNLWDTTGNDYSGIDAGAQTVTTGHANALGCW